MDVFSEGFDCPPDVEFVQMARPTLSLAKYLQQAGRGLRKSAGKETCVLIDNVVDSTVCSVCPPWHGTGRRCSVGIWLEGEYGPPDMGTEQVQKLSPRKIHVRTSVWK